MMLKWTYMKKNWRLLNSHYFIYLVMRYEAGSDEEIEWLEIISQFFFTSLYSLMDWNTDDCFFGLYTYFGMLRFALKVIIDAGKCGRERQWAVIFDLFNQTLALISKLLEVIRWSLFFHCMRKNPQFFCVCIFYIEINRARKRRQKKISIESKKNCI